MRRETHGTAGDDTLTGTINSEILSGLDGNDTLFGGGDWLYGGADALYGHLDPAERDDALDSVSYKGSAGGDTLTGGDGQDRLYGGEGNDTLDGEAKADTLHGGTGDDILRGGDADDWIHTGLGRDHAYGGASDDRFPGTHEELAFDEPDLRGAAWKFPIGLVPASDTGCSSQPVLSRVAPEAAPLSAQRQFGSGTPTLIAGTNPTTTGR
ncbi:MAG TPA: calcium-binding protein [Azospirillaceae bacterium]|nr:calcium-binding protein [Azospirillaceae bacterium]